MMEKNYKIIIILLIIIIAILAIGLGTMLLQNMQKEECSITINCDDVMHDGDKVKIKLKDLNKTPIANATINIQLKTGQNTSEYDVKTNSKGIATLALNDLEDGEYIINCTFNGNEHYKQANSSKKFNYDKEVSTSSKSSNVDSIDANRPTNDVNYKGYTPYHESEVTSDGWNPKDHEVSRESLGDGNEKIRYDDGYFRIVDSNGYVITYGYG